MLLAPLELKKMFKYQSPSKLRPGYFQAKEPRGTSKFTKKYNNFHTLYHIVFSFKEKIHMGEQVRESDNIPHQGK